MAAYLFESSNSSALPGARAVPLYFDLAMRGECRETLAPLSPYGSPNREARQSDTADEQ